LIRKLSALARRGGCEVEAFTGTEGVARHGPSATGAWVRTIERITASPFRLVATCIFTSQHSVPPLVLDKQEVSGSIPLRPHQQAVK
jgi:hypothetical protein